MSAFIPIIPDHDIINREAPDRQQLPRRFQTLVAAFSAAFIHEEEAQVVAWDPAVSVFSEVADAAWTRVLSLAGEIAGLAPGSMTDAALIGAARIIHQAVACESEARLFFLLDQMRRAQDLLYRTSPSPALAVAEHLLTMAFGLIERLCLDVHPELGSGPIDDRSLTA